MTNKRIIQFLCGVTFLTLTSCGGLHHVQNQEPDPVQTTSPKIEKTATKQTSVSKEPALKTYHGMSSWYSIKTNYGRTTASGRLLSNGARTAAHKTLPFGTRIRVTSLFNGKSEILRITDRGPYTKGRILDVTMGCAQRLGFHSRGITKVKVEVLEWGTWKYRRS